MFYICLYGMLIVSFLTFEASTLSIRPQPISPIHDHWRNAENMTNERMLFASVLLKEMNVVLHVGGCCTISAIDAFFVSNGSIIHQGDMSTTRADHTADVLPNELVLIAGCPVGLNTKKLNRNNANCVADLYNPRLGNISKEVKMVSCRFRHKSALMHTPNSTKVLLVGGNDGSNLATGEVFDSKKEKFYPVNNTMTEPREFHTATALPSGHVIIAGGCRNDGDCLDTLILYNSRVNRFFPLSARLSSKRAFHTATYIPSIEAILFVSGNTFDLLDIPTLTFISNGTTLDTREEHTATLLLDGRVLITGGIKDYGLVSCEIYDPSLDKFIPAASMAIGRYWHTATLIPETGEVLICGGRNLQGLFNSCELYSP